VEQSVCARGLERVARLIVSKAAKRFQNPPCRKSLLLRGLFCLSAFADYSQDQQPFVLLGFLSWNYYVVCVFMRTATLPNGAVLRVVDHVVEFVGPRNVERVFGIASDRALTLARQGEIELIHVKPPGYANGIRLYSAQSIRDFIGRNSRRAQPRLPAEELAKEEL
jgi:hypothetical protein